jgi:hypothetical protein
MKMQPKKVIFATRPAFGSKEPQKNWECNENSKIEIRQMWLDAGLTTNMYLLVEQKKKLRLKSRQKEKAAKENDTKEKWKKATERWA